MKAKHLQYALVTPARNEAAFIAATIESVIGQTLRPQRWVIVSDGSTDGTDEVVEKYLEDHDWIELLRRPERLERHFGGKVEAFKAGFERLKDLGHDVVGSLDADITFEPDYFAFLIDKMERDPKLGVTGTPFVEGDGESYDFRFSNVEHVSGACQLFRKGCFEDIGGYVPVKGGGIDWLAVTTARMKGWKTRTFTEMVCHHHRPMGTAESSKAMASFKLGRQDYYLGGHPLWQVFRGIFQLARKPYIIGGMLLIIGYGWDWIRGRERVVSGELMAFHRREQMARLRSKLGLGARRVEAAHPSN